MPTKRKGREEAASKAGKAVFRVHRRAVGLTYSAPRSLPEHPIASKERIRDVLTDKFGPNVHEVCQEFHKNDKRHYHAWFKFDSKLDTEDPRAFDIDGVHPEINNPGAGWRGYLKKTDSELLTNVEPCPFGQALAAATVSEGMDILALRRPGDYLRFGESMERNLRRRLEAVPAPIQYYGPYLPAWFPDFWRPDTHSLLLWGRPGVNKTQYARYLLQHFVGDHEYIKGSHEAIKRLSLRKPFIHDEISCLGDRCDPATSREITDVECGGEVICRNSNVYIPPGLPRIFVSNIAFPFRNPGEAVYGRRLVSMELQI